MKAFYCQCVAFQPLPPVMEVMRAWLSVEGLEDGKPTWNSEKSLEIPPQPQQVLCE